MILVLALAHALTSGALAHRSLGQNASDVRRARFAITIGTLAFAFVIVLELSGAGEVIQGG